jgi:hypothetical protein
MKREEEGEEIHIGTLKEREKRKENKKAREGWT